MFSQGHEGRIAGLVYVTLILGLFVMGGLFPRYYNPSDSIVVLHSDTQKTMSLADSARHWVGWQHTVHRFMPFYQIHHALTAALFRMHLSLRLVYYGFLFACSGLFLFLFARRIAFTVFESFVFPLLFFLGAQTEVWWIFDHSESLGIFFLSACLFLSALRGRDHAKRRLLDVLFFLSLVLMSGCKEVFTASIPAVLFIRWWICRDRLIPAAGMILFILESLWILLFVGTSGTGYAGFDAFSWKLCVNAGRELFLGANGILLVFVLLLAAISLCIQRANRKEALSGLGVTAIFFLLLTLPAVFLYAKSGLMNRYLLPAAGGYAFFILWCLKRVRLGPLVFRVAGAIALIGVLVFAGVKEVRAARSFSNESANLRGLIQCLITAAGPEDLILVAAEPVRHCENASGLREYLVREAGRKQVFLYPLARYDYNDFQLSLVRFTFNTYEKKVDTGALDRTGLKAIAVLPGIDYFFGLQAAFWFKRGEYERKVFGPFTAYVKK